MKQIYYAIQSTLHGRGSNVTKVISLSLGLTIGVLLFSQIALNSIMKNVTLMPTDWCWYVEEERM